MPHMMEFAAWLWSIGECAGIVCLLEITVLYDATDLIKLWRHTTHEILSEVVTDSCLDRPGRLGRSNSILYDVCAH